MMVKQLSLLSAGCSANNGGSQEISCRTRTRRDSERHLSRERDFSKSMVGDWYGSGKSTVRNMING